MATYSDMVTLLLTFFVLMMSMATFEDVKRVQSVIDSLREAFGVAGMFQDTTHTWKEEGYTEPKREVQSIQPVIAKLREAMAKHLSDDVIRMSQTPTEVRIRLDDRVFFAPGSTQLHPAAYAFVGDIAKVLANEQVEVRVEGHTDASGDEVRNWVLSAERATSVVVALRERGPIPGERLEAVGLGSFRVASDFGETDEWNRRVEIVLRADEVGAGAAVRELELKGGPDAGI
ncbi:MAG: OmpA family protein [Deltaproteobacteria bacterium]|nr:OmpA family protein [Deltaproteobacteria bacterium]